MIEDASPAANSYPARRGQFQNGMEYLTWGTGSSLPPRARNIYLFNLAFLLIGVAIPRMPSKLSCAAGLGLRHGGALTLSLLVFYSAFYQVRLDYRFEVTAISIT
jgi:hypothetical protein